MSMRKQVIVLQEAMIEAVERQDQPLNYFAARDTVFQYAENIVANKPLSANVGYLPPNVIERLKNASITLADIKFAKDEHRQNNRVLREAAIYLLNQKKPNGDAITVYDVKDEITKVLAGKTPAFPDLYNYQTLLVYHIDKIDVAHVFEGCHNDAIHAMITISHIPPAEAYHEVILVANHELEQYPQRAKEAKDLVKKEAIKFINSGEGLVVNAEQHIKFLLTDQIREGLTDEQLQIANTPYLFIKYLFTAELKNELAELAMATYLKAPQPLAKPAPFPLAAKVSSSDNLTSNNFSGSVKTTTPEIVLLDAANTSHMVSSGFLLTAYNHVGDNKEAYVVGGLLFLAIMYCTGKLKHINPLPSLRGLCTTLFGDSKSRAYKQMLTGYDKVNGSDSDHDDVEARSTGRNKGQGYYRKTHR
ncbi:MAG: hypothetical protein V4501_07565 [Pseudomonadota bacterium]